MVGLQPAYSLKTRQRHYSGCLSFTLRSSRRETSGTSYLSLSRLFSGLFQFRGYRWLPPSGEANLVTLFISLSRLPALLSTHSACCTSFLLRRPIYFELLPFRLKLRPGRDLVESFCRISLAPALCIHPGQYYTTFPLVTSSF